MANAGFMSRVAAALRSQRTPKTQAAGTGGTPIYGGFVVSTEKNADLAGVKRYETFAETMANVSIVGAGVRAFLNLAGGDWTVEPSEQSGGEEVADLWEDVMHDMTSPWERIVRKTSLYRFYGNSVQEWVGKKRDDGKFGFLDVEARPQHTIQQWDVDESGTVQGVVQRTPYDGSERWIQRGRMVYAVDDAVTDSPEGVGLLRHVMEDVRTLQRYLQLEGFGYETDLKGVPVGKAPFALLNDLVKNNKMTKEERNARLKPITDFVTKHVVNPQLGLLLDSLTYQDKSADATPSAISQFSMELLKGDVGTTHEAQHKAIERLVRQIARVLNVEWLLLGGDGKGSQALSEDKTAMFAAFLNGTRGDLAWIYRNDLILPWCAFNNIDKKLAPKLKPNPVRTQSVTEITKALVDLSTAGAVILPGDKVVNQIRTMMNLVEVDEKLMEQAASMAQEAHEAAIAPKVPPPGQPGAEEDEEPAPEEEKRAPRFLTTERSDAVRLLKTEKGVMVALMLPPATVAALREQLGDVPEADLHVTLAYLGKGLAVDQVLSAMQAARQVAEGHRGQLEATLGGLGRFSASGTSDGRDVIYASVDSADLTDLRYELCQQLRWRGVPEKRDHGYVPHVTLAYVDREQASPWARMEPITASFDALTLSAGAERTTMPFSPREEI